MKHSLKNSLVFGRRIISLFFFSLSFALLLAACGENPTSVSLSLPTATTSPVATAIPTVTPEPSPTATAIPTVTPQPSPTTAPTRTPSPTSRPRPTATPAPTVKPATAETPAAVNADVELKVIKTAYDLLVRNYYTQPDTATVAQKALEQTATSLGVSPPAKLEWNSTNSAANWKLFEAEFRTLVQASNTANKLLPPRVLAHEVVNAIALSVGDLHTYFLDEARTDSWNRRMRGDNSNVGFGVTFTYYQNAYYVLRLVTGSPAAQAGFKIGDKVKSFDSAELTQANFARISRVQEGQSYEFVFERPGESQPVTLKVEAKRYKILTAEWKILNGNVGYILLNAFHTDVEKKLDEAIADLRTKNAESLIIDLRTNGGGYNFDKVSGRFVKDGEILGRFVTRGKPTNLNAKSENKYIDPPLPLVVLIDRGSASASEVFSMAVRDYKVGTLIGGKTIGAIGTVNAWPLGDGTSLAVTISVYENFKGERLNGVGVTPDIAVTRSTADILAGRDPQLDAALKHLAEKAKSQP